jgi:hypothetical protein
MPLAFKFRAFPTFVTADGAVDLKASGECGREANFVFVNYISIATISSHLADVNIQ